VIQDFAGAAVDVTVTDLDRAERFYSVLIGRSCDTKAGLAIRERLAAADPSNTAGSATCRSAATSWETWRWPAGT